MPLRIHPHYIAVGAGIVTSYAVTAVQSGFLRRDGFVAAVARVQGWGGGEGFFCGEGEG